MHQELKPFQMILFWDQQIWKHTLEYFQIRRHGMECGFLNGIGDYLNFWFSGLLWEFKRGNLFKWEDGAWSVYGVEIGDHIFPFVPAWQRLLATRVSQIQILISPERNFCHIFCDADLIAGLYTVNTSIARARALATDQWPAYSSVFCFHASSPASPNIVKAKKAQTRALSSQAAHFQWVGQPDFRPAQLPHSGSPIIIFWPLTPPPISLSFSTPVVGNQYTAA